MNTRIYNAKILTMDIMLNISVREMELLLQVCHFAIC